MINPQCQIFSSVSNSVLRQAFSASAPRMFTKLSTAVLENLEIVPGQWIKPGVRRVSHRSPWHAIPPAQFLGGISNILLNQSLKLFFLRMSTIGPQHCPGSLWIVRIRRRDPFPAPADAPPDGVPLHGRAGRHAARAPFFGRHAAAASTGRPLDAIPNRLSARHPVREPVCPFFKQIQEPPFQSMA